MNTILEKKNVVKNLCLGLFAIEFTKFMEKMTNRLKSLRFVHSDCASESL